MTTFLNLFSAFALASALRVGDRVQTTHGVWLPSASGQPVWLRAGQSGTVAGNDYGDLWATWDDQTITAKSTWLHTTDQKWGSRRYDHVKVLNRLPHDLDARSLRIREDVHLSGIHEKYVFRDAEGRDYIFKPQRFEDNNEFLGLLDQATSEVMDSLGVQYCSIAADQGCRAQHAGRQRRRQGRLAAARVRRSPWHVRRAL